MQIALIREAERDRNARSPESGIQVERLTDLRLGLFDAADVEKAQPETVVDRRRQRIQIESDGQLGKPGFRLAPGTQPVAVPLVRRRVSRAQLDGTPILLPRSPWSHWKN